MSASGLPDEAIRRKAYEFWEAGGYVHGRDKEDWNRAVEALLQADAKDRPEPHGVAGSVPQSIGAIIADGVEAVTALASGAVSVIEELFAHRKSRDGAD